MDLYQKAAGVFEVNLSLQQKRNKSVNCCWLLTLSLFTYTHPCFLCVEWGPPASGSWTAGKSLQTSGQVKKVKGMNLRWGDIESSHLCWLLYMGCCCFLYRISYSCRSCCFSECWCRKPWSKLKDRTFILIPHLDLSYKKRKVFYFI